MTQHIHAIAMRLYAEDAMHSETPWEQWDIHSGVDWHPLREPPSWHQANRYRRRSSQEVDRQPFELGQKCFVANIQNAQLYDVRQWSNKSDMQRLARRGLVFHTKEEAIAHSITLLGEENA